MNIAIARWKNAIAASAIASVALIGAQAASAQATQKPQQPKNNIVYVRADGGVKSYRAPSGHLIDTILERNAPSVFAYALTSGPGDMLYIGSYNHVLRYQGSTGAALGTLFSAGDYESIINLAAASDGLYVQTNNVVVKIDSQSGAVLETILSGANPYPAAGTPTSAQQIADMRLGPDGNLYMLDSESHTLFRYNTQTHAFASPITLDAPDTALGYAFTFAPDGSLLIAEGFKGDLSNTPNRIFRYGAGGQLQGVFAQQSATSCLEFKSDHTLYACQEDGVRSYTWPSANDQGVVVPSEGASSLPYDVAFATKN